MSRESQTLSFIVDLMLQGKLAAACDVVVQRLKSLEQVAGGAHYLVSQRQELVPLESQVMSTPMETIEAARLHREEQKAKSAASKPWERRTEWERRNEEQKGKGKGKESKGKGKPKGDKQGQSREDRERERKG